MPFLSFATAFRKNGAESFRARKIFQNDLKRRSFLEKRPFFGKTDSVQFLTFRRLILAFILAGIGCLVSRQKMPEAETVSRKQEVVAARPLGWRVEDLKAQSVNLRDARDFFAERPIFAEFEDADGRIKKFRAGCVLVRWNDGCEVSAVPTGIGAEIAIRDLLLESPEVTFAELDLLADRQSLSINDPRATNQWHHAVIGTTNAWQVSPGKKTVRIGIIDDAFQMDHPDLAANVVPGWDMDRNQPITSAAGHWHSTRGAGLAAAIAGNGIGIAGVSQCAILPISGTNYTISFFYNAIVWAADHNVRVVNASWDIANSATINSAAQYLRDQIQGILLVPGENIRRQLSYVNHPYIFAVSMTDELDEDISAYGNHIDLAAPGWNIYSTTSGNGYEYDTGTSYSTPIVAGVAAALLSINPSLTTDQLIALLKTSADDLGQPGYDIFYGSGRLNYKRAALAAFATLPVSRINQVGPRTVTVPQMPNAQYQLGRAPDPAGPWNPIQALITTNENVIRFEDPDSNLSSFYRVQVTLP
jgi:subtilisin family serine protease